jgi:hypothetical protein
MTRSNRIQIFCDGGFGNRLNTLLSGLAVANLFELRATVYWPRNNWCQAAFGDIFSNNFDISEQSLSDLAGTLDNAIVLLHDQLGADALRVPFHSAYAYTSTDDFLTQALTTGKDIFYYPALIPPWLPMDLVADAIQMCHYQASIREAVTNFVGKTIGQPFHGLHLRRTDLNVGFTDNEVQDIVRQHPKEAFFVCSDDPIAEALAAAHPHVYHREKRAYVDKRNAQDGWTTLTADDDGRLYHSNIDRNADSVIDAVIDMLILAHSSIVGFSGSTFQNMARLYGTHAPMVPVAKPALEVSYLSLNTASRMIQSGAMSLGEALSHAAALYSAGRKVDAIQLEKAAIEYGRTKGMNDVNLFVLHYNVAAHLINGGAPYEAGLYLEKALVLIPDHAESKALLIAARQRSGFSEIKPPEPQTRSTGVSHFQRDSIKTFMQWHLGDNLIHLHFLRKLSEKYPELEFQHALNPAYIGQCTEVIEDNPRIILTPLVPGQNPEGLDGWKGAGGFFFSHENKYQFGALYLDLFAKLSKDMGLSTPFKTTDDLLFDYPAIVTKQTTGSYDVVLINSTPLSNQFKTYNENDFTALAHILRDKGFSVITSKKIDTFDCTLDTQCSVTDIANISLRAKYFIAVCTGAMWPCINVFNQGTHQFKIILNDHETVDIGKNITMCTDTRLLQDMVSNFLK